MCHRRVKDYCIARGFSWVASTAHTVCSEADYYEDLLRAYRANKRVRGLARIGAGTGGDADRGGCCAEWD